VSGQAPREIITEVIDDPMRVAAQAPPEASEETRARLAASALGAVFCRGCRVGEVENPLLQPFDDLWTSTSLRRQFCSDACYEKWYKNPHNQGIATLYDKRGALRGARRRRGSESP